MNALSAWHSGHSYLLQAVRDASAKLAIIIERSLATSGLAQALDRRQHRELWGDVSDRLRMLVDPSVEVLAEHLEDNYDRSRFRAATTILRMVKLRCSTGD